MQGDEQDEQDEISMELTNEIHQLESSEQEDEIEEPSEITNNNHQSPSHQSPIHHPTSQSPLHHPTSQSLIHHPTSQSPVLSSAANHSPVLSAAGSPSKRTINAASPTLIKNHSISSPIQASRKSPSLSAAGSPSKNAKPKSPTKSPSPIKSSLGDEELDYFEGYNPAALRSLAAKPTPSKPVAPVAVNPDHLKSVDSADQDEKYSKEKLIWEQQAHALESKLFDLTKSLNATRSEKEQLAAANAKQAQELTNLKKSLSEKEIALDQELNSKADLGLKSIEFSQEKQNLAASIISKEQEIIGLSEDLTRANSQISELKHELRIEKEKLSDAQANELSLKSESMSNAHELEQSRKMNEWLSKELETKSNEFSTYRSEKILQIKTLQSDLEEAVQEKHGLELRSNLLQKRGDDLEQKLSDKMNVLREEENKKIVAEQQFKNEMTSQKKLTELYLGKCQELDSHNQELESLVRELEKKVSELVSDKEESGSSLQKELDLHKQKVQEQALELEKLQSQIKLINTDAQMEIRTDQIAQLSSTAAAASRFQKTGKSFTQVYSDYAQLQKDYIIEKSEVARLNECLNHIVSEFEQRAPLIQKTNEEYQKAREHIERLSIELSNAVREKNEAMVLYRNIKADMDSVEQSQKLLEKELDDRNRQLRGVLREFEILKGTHSSTLPPESDDLSHLTGADAIIAKRLVVFKNIDDLQTQNQNLLRSIRSLSAKMEAQEKANHEQADSARDEALNESAKLIESLQERLKRETLNAESYAKERDQWRRMAETKAHPSSVQASPSQSPEKTRIAPSGSVPSNGPDYESFYRELQREFDAYRKESGTDTKMLKAQIDGIYSEKTELSVQVAKLNNQIDYLNERHELAVQSSKAKDQESQQLRQRLTAINETATRQDIKIEELSNNLLQARQASESINAENQQLKIERQIWKSSEARIMKESKDFLKERNSANDRIRELQDALEENDRKAVAKVKRLEDRMEELNRDLQLSRKQLADVIDDHRTLSAKRDAEIRESQIKTEKLTVEYERAKGELALMKNKEQNATLRIQELNSKITSLEQKSVIFDGRPRPVISGEVPADTPLFDLQSELRQVKIELEASKSELAVAREQADVFKTISQASEDRLAEMNSTYDLYKNEMENKITELENTIERLEGDKSEIQSRLTKLGETLTETQEKMDGQVDEFNSAKALYEKQIQKLKESEESAVKSAAAMKVDLDRQIQQAQDGQANYEREVVLHSASLQSLTNLKAANAELIQERDEATLTLQASVDKLSALQLSFDSVKGKLEQDIVDLENRIEDLKTQNNLLHSQFEQLSISKTHFAVETEQVEEGQEPPLKAISDLGEVIKFLRREKEIVETKLQISIQENERSRMQLEQFQKSLDESRALLDEERKKSQDNLGSERKHNELLEKIEQTNLLRESNITLRSQLESSQKKIDVLDQKLKSAEILIEPLRGQVSQLEIEVEARKAEEKALLEDNARWKGRAQQILEKYERIDPVEHENLKSTVATLTLQKAELESQLLAASSGNQDKINEHEKAVDDLRAEIESLKEAHEKQLAEKENELSGLRDPDTNEHIVSLTEELQNAKTKNKSFVKEANNKIKAKTAKINQLTAEIEEAKAAMAKSEGKLKLAIQEAESRIAAVKQIEIEKLTLDMEKSFAEKLKKFQASVKPIVASTIVTSTVTPEPIAPSAQTPTPKRTREEPVPSSVAAVDASGSPNAKRVRVEEPKIAVGQEKIAQPIVPEMNIEVAAVPENIPEAEEDLQEEFAEDLEGGDDDEGEGDELEEQFEEEMDDDIPEEGAVIEEPEVEQVQDAAVVVDDIHDDDAQNKNDSSAEDEFIGFTPEPTGALEMEEELVDQDEGSAEERPVSPEPVKAEPVKIEPVKAEPVKAEPVKAEPVKAEPVKSEPVAKASNVAADVPTLSFKPPVKVTIQAPAAAAETQPAIATQKAPNPINQQANVTKSLKVPESTPAPAKITLKRTVIPAAAGAQGESQTSAEKAAEEIRKKKTLLLQQKLLAEKKKTDGAAATTGKARIVRGPAPASGESNAGVASRGRGRGAITLVRGRGRGRGSPK